MLGPDHTIISYPLRNGLNFQYLDANRVIQSISEISSMPIQSILRRAHENRWINSEGYTGDKIAIVEGTFSAPFQEKDMVTMQFWDWIENNLNDAILKSYFINTISYMRLFQKGMISFGDRWLYYSKNGKLFPLASFSSCWQYLTQPRYSIEPSDLKNLETFVDDMLLTFPKDERFVKALNAFNRSYDLEFASADLSFLALDASMECLVSKVNYPSKDFKKNVAKLVAHNMKNGYNYSNVLNKMDEYYLDRCSIAHNLGIIDPTPILPKISEIRDYARIVIKEGLIFQKAGIDPLKGAEKIAP